MEKAIVKFLFFAYSHFWYFFRAHLAHYSITDKQEDAISRSATIPQRRIRQGTKTEKQADVEQPQPGANRDFPGPATKTSDMTHGHHRHGQARNDPAPMPRRIKISLARTTIPAEGNPDNPKIAPMKIGQQAEITRHNDNRPRRTPYYHPAGTRLAYDNRRDNMVLQP
jgi:hypothetical protein